MKVKYQLNITLPEIPSENIDDGLLVVFDKETERETKYAYADIVAGKKVYELPDQKERKIVAVYLKVL